MIETSLDRPRTTTASSVNFKNLQTFSGNIRKRHAAFGQLLEILRKSSNGSQKSSENRHKRCR